MKTRILSLFFILFIFSVASAQQRIFYVADVGNNADIYYMPNVNTPGTVRRLTTHAAIDNHPDYYIKTVAPYDTVVVWSSNRDGDFELWYGTLPNLEATATKITDNIYPDRHPHFSHDGQWIIYTAKYRFEPLITCPKSECSIPVFTPCGWFEGLRIIKVGTWQIYDFDLRSMSITGGGSWPSLFSTWIGHPSFSHTDSRIIFSAAVDSNGTNWEVYSVSWTSPNVIGNLTRHTQGSLYPGTPNPIPMSAGAYYSSNSTMIVYTSTRTPLGNSQLFRISAASVNAPVDPTNQVTWHLGNDYVPEVLGDGRIILTSDLGPNNICPPPDTGASDDLDLVIINSDGSNRINLTNNNSNDEMLLIGDEVSWFCGLKPNLSECTFYPKSWNVCWWKIFYRLGSEPSYLPNFPNRDRYTRAWRVVTEYMYAHNQTYLQNLMQAMSMNWAQCDVSWLNVQSWWIVPSIFARIDTLKAPNPFLIVPPNKSALYSSPVQFDWSDINGAMNYGLQVSSSPGFSAPVINQTNLAQSQYSASLSNGRWYWRASANNSYGSSWSTVWYTDVLVNIEPLSNEIPTEFFLYQNFPNPFNPRTKIKFDIPSEQKVRLVVYNILGSEVAVLVDHGLKGGKYEVEWNAENYPSGIYYYRIETSDYMVTKRMVLVK